MERRFETDFSDVCVHCEYRRSGSRKAINAHAYTAGNHIVFADEGYDTTSTQGLRILAHELTHVVQQRSGHMSGIPMGEGLSVSEPGDPFAGPGPGFSNAARCPGLISAVGS
jgi:hypothetical protein